MEVPTNMAPIARVPSLPAARSQATSQTPADGQRVNALDECSPFGRGFPGAQSDLVRKTVRYKVIAHPRVTVPRSTSHALLLLIDRENAPRDALANQQGPAVKVWRAAVHKH